MRARHIFVLNNRVVLMRANELANIPRAISDKISILCNLTEAEAKSFEERIPYDRIEGAKHFYCAMMDDGYVLIANTLDGLNYCEKITYNKENTIKPLLVFRVDFNHRKGSVIVDRLKSIVKK